MTNEELFKDLLNVFGSQWTARYCKMRAYELRVLYEHNTYSPEDLTYDINFWLEKEQYMLDIITQELLSQNNNSTQAQF